MTDVRTRGRMSEARGYRKPVCIFFNQKRCYRSIRCPYLHIFKICGHYQPLKGRKSCPRGERCPYAHLNAEEYAAAKTFNLVQEPDWKKFDKTKEDGEISPSRSRSASPARKK